MMIFVKCWKGMATVKTVIYFRKDNLLGKVTLIRNLLHKKGFNCKIWRTRTLF